MERHHSTGSGHGSEESVPETARVLSVDVDAVSAGYRPPARHRGIVVGTGPAEASLVASWG